MEFTIITTKGYNQVLLYNYQLAPTIKILAGSTTATITLTGIDDTTDEDETIVLTTRNSVKCWLKFQVA
jgi:hypothetical protein